MEISKECPCLNQYYYETWNSYLNVYLLKKVVLLSNHENHLQKIFWPRNIVYLLLLLVESYHIHIFLIHTCTCNSTFFCLQFLTLHCLKNNLLFSCEAGVSLKTSFENYIIINERTMNEYFRTETEKLMKNIFGRSA